MHYVNLCMVSVWEFKSGCLCAVCCHLTAQTTPVSGCTGNSRWVNYPNSNCSTDIVVSVFAGGPLASLVIKSK